MKLAEPQESNFRNAVEALHHFYRKGTLEAITPTVHRIRVKKPYPSELGHALWYMGIQPNGKQEYSLTYEQAERIYPFANCSGFTLRTFDWFKPQYPYTSSGYHVATRQHTAIWLAEDLKGNVWNLPDYIHCLQWEGFITIHSYEIFTPANEKLFGKSPMQVYQGKEHAIVNLFINKEAVK